MKKPSQQTLKKVIPAFLSGIIAITANAQKLPPIQQSSLSAPANIKIDGKPTEWHNQFQAYNKSNDIYYSIANDKNNLYLIVQATYAHPIEKIISGGLTFTVKNADKKNKNAAASITFPLLSVSDRSSIARKVKSTDETTPYNEAEVNKQFATAAKEMDVRGIKEVTDTLLSVYNETGIKTGTSFDDKKVFTYELSIPLKYLQQCLGSDGKLSYNIRLNEMRVIPMASGTRGAIISVVNVRMGSKEMDDMQDLHSSTDFSGEYILVKK